MQRSLQRVLGGIAALISVTATLQAQHAGPPTTRLRPTPAPPFRGAPPAVSRSDWNAYLRLLRFDMSHAASDEQHLLVRSGSELSVGPEAMIAPEIGAGILDTAVHAAGRVIGVLRLGGPYAPLGLPAGTFHLWVDGQPLGRRLLLVPTAGDSIYEFPMYLDSTAMEVPICYPPQARITEYAASPTGVIGFCVCCAPFFWCKMGREVRMGGERRFEVPMPRIIPWERGR